MKIIAAAPAISFITASAAAAGIFYVRFSINVYATLRQYLKANGALGRPVAEPVEGVGVNHSRIYVGVSRHSLNRREVCAPLERERNGRMS
jgi:hypothetical protein